MTKTQVAALLGTIPETVSRVFAGLTQKSLISINGSFITILERNDIDPAEAEFHFLMKNPNQNYKIFK